MSNAKKVRERQKKRRARAASNLHANPSSPESEQQPQPQPQPAAGSWSEWFSSWRQYISDIAQVTAPFVKNPILSAATLANNLALPLFMAAISNYLLKPKEDDSEEMEMVKKFLAVSLPILAMATRTSVNTLLTGLLREEIRKSIIEMLLRGDFNINNHSPHAKGMGDVINTTNMSTAQFAQSFSSRAFAVGDLLDLTALMNSIAKLAGINNAIASGFTALLFSLLTTKASSMGNNLADKGLRKDEAIGITLRSFDINKLQIAGLNANEHEVRKLLEMIEERRGMRISKSSIDFLANSMQMFLLYLAPQMLRSFKSAHPEGMTPKQIEEFSRQVLLLITTVGNIIKPLAANQKEFEINLAKLKQLHAVMNDVIEFLDKAPLKINYSCGGDAVEIVNLTMAKPSEGDHESLAERVEASLGNRELTTIINANIKLEGGKTYQLLGQSGLGKSSFLKVCSGLWPYTSGTINFPCSKEEVYFITQEPFMPRKSTLLEIMVYPQDVTEIEGDKKEKLISLIKTLGLSERIKDLNDKEPKDWSILSRGEQQRIAVIRMIMRDPKPHVILMDEATASVDEERSSQMYKMIRDHLPKATIIYVSHETHKTTDLHGKQSQPSSTFEISPFANATITIDKETGQLSLVELGARTFKIDGAERGGVQA